MEGIFRQSTNSVVRNTPTGKQVNSDEVAWITSNLWHYYFLRLLNKLYSKLLRSAISICLLSYNANKDSLWQTTLPN